MQLSSLQGFLTDWRFLTILPAPQTGEQDGAALDVRFFPVVGWIVGALGAGVYLLADAFDLSAMLCALLALGCCSACTGLLHEDGLGDIADSMGGRSREHRLEILRDSRIGAYGVMTLLFVLLLRLGALTALGMQDAWLAAITLMSAGAFSRAAMACLARALDNAREDGLSASLLPTPSSQDLAIAIVIAILPGLLLTGIAMMILALLLGGVLLAAVSLWAQRQLGGRTGDVLGASQLLTEMGFLLAANLVFVAAL